MAVRLDAQVLKIFKPETFKAKGATRGSLKPRCHDGTRGLVLATCFTSSPPRMSSVV
jgi:hypothetical protein